MRETKHVLQRMCFFYSLKSIIMLTPKLVKGFFVSPNLDHPVINAKHVLSITRYERAHEFGIRFILMVDESDYFTHPVAWFYDNQEDRDKCFAVLLNDPINEAQTALRDMVFKYLPDIEVIIVDALNRFHDQDFGDNFPFDSDSEPEGPKNDPL